MNRSQALETALHVWNDVRAEDQPRLDRIDQRLRVPDPISDDMWASSVTGGRRYVGPRSSSVEIPEDAPELMYRLAEKSRTNYLPLLVRTFRQSLRVEGYITRVRAEQNPWRWWQRNRLDARQVAIHDAVIKYGTAYASVLPVPSQTIGYGADGTVGNVPQVRIFTPRHMSTMWHDAEYDEHPALAVHTEGQHLVLMDEERVWRFGIEGLDMANREQVSADGDAVIRTIGTRQLRYLEDRPHGLGVCPVVRYRDQFVLAGEPHYGIVEPLIVIQDRIDETSFGQLVAQYFAAFKQRAVLGWVPDSEAQELKAGAARIWYLDVDPGQVRIEELTETDLTRYIDAGNSARRDFAAIAQIPSASLGVDAISNISDATLAGLDKSKNERAGEIALSVGESHEQLMRLMAWSVGDREAATDWDGEVRWAKREARTWAGQIDGLVKLVQSEILTRETAVGMVPDMTDQQVEAARAEARKNRMAANAVAARAARAAGQQQVPGQPPVPGTTFGETMQAPNPDMNGAAGAD